MNWAAINQRISSARASSDPVAQLQKLFAETRDGHVAMALAREYERRHDDQQALKWCSEAEARYPIERFKQQARESRRRLAAALTDAASSVSTFGLTQDMDLHIVSCSEHKIWRDHPQAPIYVPAREAYCGNEITNWLKNPLSNTSRWLILSAKHGFIEPDQPIADYNVTFNDPTTGPITDDALRAQANHQVRWPDRVRLRAFPRVIVHGSASYVQRTEAAFRHTGASVVSSADIPGRAAPPATMQLPRSDSTDRVSAVGSALGALPPSVYERLDLGEPEWRVLRRLQDLKHPLSTITALAIGLCDYQVGTGGAAQYWATVANLLGRRSIRSADDVLAFIEALVREPVSKRLAKTKVKRIQKFICSDLVGWVSSRSFEEVASQAKTLWVRLAIVMRQDCEDKTIAFAMKCFDLLHRAAIGEYVRLDDAPIIVDLRIARISVTSGLLPVADGDVLGALQDATNLALARHGEMIRVWKQVQAVAGGISLFRIDSLGWQLAEPIYAKRHDRSRAVHEATSILISGGAAHDSAARVARELTHMLEEGQPVDV